MKPSHIDTETEDYSKRDYVVKEGAYNLYDCAPTFNDCCQIFVLNKSVERGTHDELLPLQGRMPKWWLFELILWALFSFRNGVFFDTCGKQNFYCFSREFMVHKAA